MNGDRVRRGIEYFENGDWLLRRAERLMGEQPSYAAELAAQADDWYRRAEGEFRAALADFGGVAS